MAGSSSGGVFWARNFFAKGFFVECFLVRKRLFLRKVNISVEPIKHALAARRMMQL
jgi:hypothetical protein